jgi:cell division protein FtsL
MLIALTAALSGAVLYLGKRLLDARSEVAELRTQVAVLKRRLVKART